MSLACIITVFNVFDGENLTDMSRNLFIITNVEYCGFYDKNYIVVHNFNLSLARIASYWKSFNASQYETAKPLKLSKSLEVPV